MMELNADIKGIDEDIAKNKLERVQLQNKHDKKIEKEYKVLKA
ncbi:hypothetical protein [Candidatus Phytoplasma prunorum]